jgi:hypothetical protein
MNASTFSGSFSHRQRAGAPLDRRSAAGAGNQLLVLAGPWLILSILQALRPPSDSRGSWNRRSPEGAPSVA